MRPSEKQIASAFLLGALLPGQATPQTAGGTTISNQATYAYNSGSGGSTNPTQHGGRSGRVDITDPAGHVRGCQGELLPDYKGFTIGFYEPGGAGQGDVRRLLVLTPTTRARPPESGVPPGVPPNWENRNPFPLTSQELGTYTFVLDSKRGQLDAGTMHLLVVLPTPDSGYEARRIRLTVGERAGKSIRFTVSALDGEPIDHHDASATTIQAFALYDGPAPGQVLAVINLDIDLCRALGVRITKTGDRASAAPGDHVVYRIAVKNTGSEPLDRLRVADVLPVGFRFVARSMRARADGSAATPEVRESGRSLTLEFPQLKLDPGKTLRIAYATLITPGALRGRGINSATVTGRVAPADHDETRSSTVSDGPVSHRVRLEQGILTETGTLLGRVFVDGNYDGEQQRGEPGVDGAVVLLDDGTRITTDADGLFSLANVAPGYHTAVLDYTSIPGFTIARNRRFIERNSPSRLARLEPGGTARINFAVAPLNGPGSPR